MQKLFSLFTFELRTFGVNGMLLLYAEDLNGIPLLADGCSSLNTNNYKRWNELETLHHKELRILIK